MTRGLMIDWAELVTSWWPGGGSERPAGAVRWPYRYFFWVIVSVIEPVSGHPRCSFR